MLLLHLFVVGTFTLSIKCYGARPDTKRDPLDDLDDSFWSEEASVGEVEKLLRQHKENQDLIRSMGTSSYRLIYPVQMRHHEKLGISTREIGTTKSYERSLEGSRNERISTQQAGKHFHRTSLLIKAFSHKFRLDLELNTQLLAPNLIQKHFLPGGAEQISKQEIEHCYYHGSVKDYPGATAAFRTCNGVSGVIHVGNETFIIHPFYGGDLSRKHPHVIFEARAKLKQQCGNTGSLEWGLRNYRKGKTPKSINERYKRDVREVTKYVETALVLDKAMFEKRNGSRRIEVVHDAIQIANIADLYFRTLNTRISVVYIETWASENQALVDKSQDIHRALLNFNDYTSRKLFKVDKDTTQLLSGESFPSGASGMSVPDTICTTKAVGISVDLSPYEPHLVAGTMAHMIGHNVGMGHDDGREDCHCADWHGCIMSQSIVGLDNVQPYKFSECSLSDYVDTLRVGHAICLINRPSILDDFRTCGNGIVEDGEECDCGTIEECHEFDPCCDPITCKLTVEAECASGPCCDDCRLRAKGTLCREATNECDLPEVCNGRSGQCPLDISKKNGNPCEGGRGYCFGGVCPTLDNQCHQIWGYGGVAADRRCYEQFNSQGSINGHCGVDTSNNYLKCDTENVMCGSLQCQMGSRYPIVAGMDQMYSRTIFSMGGKEFECKVISGNVATATEIPDLGLVRDGTPCGNNLVCVNRTCSSIYTFIDRVKCASNNVALDCSGHGVCSNINTCFCDPGWTGHDCATQTNITYPALMGQGQYGAHDSQGQGALFRTPQPSHGTGQPASTELPLADWQKNTTKTTSYVDASGSSTVYLVAMLVSVVGGVFIVFALMALCYRSVVVHRNLSLCVRRKSTMPKYDPPYMKRPLVTPLPAKPTTANHMAAAADPNLGLEAGAKGITFGSMPSYRPVTHTNAVGAGGPNVINNFGPTSEEEAGQSGEDETAAFLDGIPNNLSKQPEKGILKKSGPYGHVGIPLTLPLVSGKEKWSEESQSDNQEVISPDSERERERGPSSASIGLSDVERTLKSLNGYHEDILQALRSAASHRSASSASLSDDLRKSFPDHYPDYFPPSEYMLLRGISHDKLAPRSSGGGPSPLGGVAVGGSTAGLLPPAGDSGDEGDLVPPCGPIRIRNLEDLIRQLERHSARHTSPNGSEDIRMSEPEADRHYRLDRLERLDRLDRLDRLESSSNPDTQGHPLRFVYGRYRKPTASSDALTELQEELQQMQELQKLEQLEKLQLQDLADEDLYPSVHGHSHGRGREKLDCAEDSDDSESVEYAGPATVRSSSDDGVIVIPSHPSSNGSVLGNGVVEYRRAAAIDYNDPRAQSLYLRSSNSEESYLEGSNSYEDNLSLPPRSVSEDSSRDTDNVLHSGGYAEYKH